MDGDRTLKMFSTSGVWPPDQKSTRLCHDRIRHQVGDEFRRLRLRFEAFAPAHLNYDVVPSEHVAGFCTQNWYMAANVEGAWLSNSCQQSKLVMAAGSGKRVAKRWNVSASRIKPPNCTSVAARNNLISRNVM